MASRIPKSAPYFPKVKSRKEPDYLHFIHLLPCVVTGLRTEIEAAHISFSNPRLGHYGRAKGAKASDRWVLPLTRNAHLEQHRVGESEFWWRHQVDPHVLCLAVYGLWTEMGNAADFLASAIITQFRESGRAEAERLRIIATGSGFSRL